MALEMSSAIDPLNLIAQVESLSGRLVDATPSTMALEMSSTRDLVPFIESLSARLVELQRSIEHSEHLKHQVFQSKGDLFPSFVKFLNELKTDIDMRLMADATRLSVQRHLDICDKSTSKLEIAVREANTLFRGTSIYRSFAQSVVEQSYSDLSSCMESFEAHIHILSRLESKLSDDDKIFVVMGETGAGKTTFISQMLGRNVGIGHGLQSETHNIRIHTIQLRGYTLRLVDTPGFNDTYRADIEVLTQISRFLKETFDRHVQVDGILYLKDISQARMAGASHRSLNLFHKLYGNGDASSLTLVTTKWDVIETKIGVTREEELKRRFWSTLVEQGCQVLKSDGSLTAARAILRSCVQRARKTTLGIQEELSIQGKALAETNAGKFVFQETKKITSEYERNLAAIDQEIQEAKKKGDVAFSESLATQKTRMEVKIRELRSATDSLQQGFENLMSENSAAKERIQVLLAKQSTQEHELEKRAQKLKEDEIELEQARQTIQTLEARFANSARATEDEFSRSVLRQNANVFASCTAQLEIVTQNMSRLEKLTADTQVELDMRQNLLQRVSSEYDSFQFPNADELSAAALVARIDAIFSVPLPRPPPYEAVVFEKHMVDIGTQTDTLSARSDSGLSDSSQSKLDIAGKSFSAIRSRTRKLKLLRQSAYERSRFHHMVKGQDQEFPSGPIPGGFGAVFDDADAPGLYLAAVHEQRMRSSSEYVHERLQSHLPRKAMVWANLLLQCRDVLANVLLSCRELQSDGLLDTAFSSIVVEKERSRVVRLCTVDIALVRKLEATLHHWLMDHFPVTGAPRRLREVVRVVMRHLKIRKLVLQIVPSALHPELDNALSKEGLVYLLHTVMVFVDLSLLFHVAGHTLEFEEAFPVKHTERGKWVLEAPPPVGESGLVVHTKKLACLDKFLDGRKVWALSTNKSRNDSEYFLSAPVAVLGSIWGPIFELTANPKDSPTRRVVYRMGSGTIQPALHDITAHPPLQSDESLAHWSADESFDESESESICASEAESPIGETLDEEDARALHAYEFVDGFHPSKRLLIGARPSPKLENTDRCRCDPREFKLYMKGKDKLHNLFTSREFLYVERNFGMTLGSHGVQVASSGVVKTGQGTTFKQTCLELWASEVEEGLFRDLENFWGVLVSLCTLNARRVRLIELFRTDTMLRRIRRFRWSDGELEEDFVDAISDVNPKSLRRLWSAASSSAQKEYASAVLYCLKALAKTGHHKETDEYSIMWFPHGMTKPLRLTFKTDEHPWMKLLVDDDDGFSMAVLTEECLACPREFDHCAYPSCQTDNNGTVLETALCINEFMTPSGFDIGHIRSFDDPPPWRTHDRRWRELWIVDTAKRRAPLWMGSSLRLKIEQPLSPTHLLLRWSSVKREVWLGYFGRNASDREKHWEYTEVDMRPAVRPVPVHIS